MNDTLFDETVQMTIDDQQRAYYAKRANDHRAMALNAVEPGIRSVHLRLQALYEERAGQPGMIQAD